MGNITIRNIPDDIHNQLRQLALQNQRSMEAEARNIIANAVNRSVGLGFGQTIRSAWGKNTGGELTTFRSADGPREVSFE